MSSSLRSSYWTNRFCISRCLSVVAWRSCAFDLNSNVPFCEDLVIMRNLMNQIANLVSQETLHDLHQCWNSSLKAMNYSPDSSAGVGYQIGSDGLSPIKNLIMLLDNSSAPAWFVLLYNHWCHLCLAKYESHVILRERAAQMVGTGQIKLGKLIMRPDGDFTWQLQHRLSST